MNQELVIVNKDLIATKDVESTKLKEELEAIKPEMENLRHQLGIKTNEFDLLRQEMVERSKSKFNEIDALKKQLVIMHCIFLKITNPFSLLDGYKIMSLYVFFSISKKRLKQNVI